MKSKHQILVDKYHSEVGHHHNMHIMHRNWHNVNTEPELPTTVDPNWGIDIRFGTDFLQMHHEMLNANKDDPKYHMMHDSISNWYENNGEFLPLGWQPNQIIPEDLGYEPDGSIYPDEIKDGISEYAQSQGLTLEQFLTRRTNNPSFELPKYFTIDGVNNAEEADPLTGAFKLADFKNTNQLGCSLVFPHNQWHGAIGGAMSTTWTAIADPIFYWGVHKFVDIVFEEYKMLQKQKQLIEKNAEVFITKNLGLPTEGIVKRNFTEKEKKKLSSFKIASKLLNPFIK